jgi:hypothetical protein
MQDARRKSAYGHHGCFYGRLAVEVVIGGELVNKAGTSYALLQMMQCCRDYPAMPDPLTLTVGQIRTFYRFLIPELQKNG